MGGQVSTWGMTMLYVLVVAKLLSYQGLMYILTQEESQLVGVKDVNDRVLGRYYRVLDFAGCAGSGTTLAVAKHLGRHAVGYELSLEYCKLALERNRQMAMGL